MFLINNFYFIKDIIFNHHNFIRYKNINQLYTSSYELFSINLITFSIFCSQSIIFLLISCKCPLFKYLGKHQSTCTTYWTSSIVPLISPKLIDFINRSSTSQSSTWHTSAIYSNFMLLSSFPHSKTISKNAIIRTFYSKNVCSARIFGNLLIDYPCWTKISLNSVILPVPRAFKRWNNHSNSVPNSEFIMSLSKSS